MLEKVKKIVGELYLYKFFPKFSHKVCRKVCGVSGCKCCKQNKSRKYLIRILGCTSILVGTCLLVFL